MFLLHTFPRASTRYRGVILIKNMFFITPPQPPPFQDGMEALEAWDLKTYAEVITRSHLNQKE